MKSFILLLTLLSLVLFIPHQSHAQKSEGDHTFKITGAKQASVYLEKVSKMSVEYDSTSTDHLYISEFRKNGFLKTKTRLLFTGKKFTLKTLNQHISKGELLVDGIQADYREDDESIASELVYKKEKLQQQTHFYRNGKKQLSFFCDENIMNGAYKMWHPNGHISFSGNYNNNIKDGEFQQFDESEKVIKKGIYQNGKLASGEAVVQDLIYENPEKKAQFIDGEKAFNDYLKKKTVIFKDMTADKDAYRIICMNLTVNKNGIVDDIKISSDPNPNDQKILNAVFSDFQGFKPALIEDTPVAGILYLELVLTNQGLQTMSESEIFRIVLNGDSLNIAANSLVEEMPSFSGGERALQQFLGRTIRYPVEAQQNGIMGKVFVKYIIEPDGSISNVRIEKGVHPLLDAEASRVVKLMPKWKPGRQKGKAVRVFYTVPINFVIQ
jgi:TonB family protein